ncbi:duf155 domain containing protein [Grosmannia clavigera kw1407]|uniref:Duf155 domain containing protein n=1 Tax=Grosmannia clavigera (strain kw1407 / UAMH 11150) TaxID=655863 RepID=F0XS72_GROCL|nr:duf155 domain containing protein [Grosmannia clavigera kw1407]EFW99458.1 duf155 domain containing protein [Grosmannia clavigera kw1407]
MAAAVSESSPLLQSGPQSQQDQTEESTRIGSTPLPAAATLTTTTTSLTSPSALARPSSGFRPKSSRSVTFDPNPVSQTIDLSPTSSPPNHEPLPAFSRSRRRNASSTTAATLPAISSSEPTPYGSMSTISNTPMSGSGTGSSGGGPPVLAAINNRLRRRNSSSSAPVHGQQRQQLQQLHQHPTALPKIGPQRTSKNAQKLKLLPNPEFGDEGPDEESGRDVYSQYTRIKDPTARRDAAFLGKADRGRLPRVTAYCTANRYQMDGLMRFLKGRSKTRGANPKLIDECIYTPYNYDYGKGNTNSSSGDGNASRKQREPENHQQRDRQQEQGWEPERDAQSSVVPSSFQHERRHSTGEVDSVSPTQLRRDDLMDLERGNLTEGDNSANHGQVVDEEAVGDEAVQSHSPGESNGLDRFYGSEHRENPYQYQDHCQDHTEEHEHIHEVSEQINGGGDEAVDLDIHVRTPEVFLFDYGVVVIWGMSEAQEQRFLKELARFETEKLAPDDVEVEFFNFYYTREYQARIYNDFIALRDDRSSSYMTKLAISHAVAQSVKTSLFEELIASTVETCKDIPTQIAMTGTIALSRSQINMQIGELFILRINIHLNGSVLDTPELFWVEPQLEPVYQAVRSYLEMDQRVGLLTQRLDVIADLLAVLKEQLSHGHGEKLEWIVIVLIAAEILVAAINIVVDVYAGE